MSEATDDYPKFRPDGVPAWPKAAVEGAASPLNAGAFSCEPGTLKVTGVRYRRPWWFARLWGRMRGRATPCEVAYTMEYRPGGHGR